MIYLDNSATTQPDRNMLNAVVEEVYQFYGNPSSQHDAGMDAKDLLEDARVKVASAINARPSEVMFTSGGTEANSLALSHHEWEHWETVFVSDVEHSSVWYAGTPDDEDENWIRVTEDGTLDFDHLDYLIEDQNRKMGRQRGRRT